MSEVKRYDPTLFHRGDGEPDVDMDEAADGDYVRYEDYAALTAQLSTLQTERAGLVEALKRASDFIHHDFECEKHVLQWTDNEERGIKRQGEKCTCHCDEECERIAAALGAPPTQDADKAKGE